MATFVLNDETVINSYGFRVLNAGIDLTRFKQNPVMLDSHWNNNYSVVGKWSNLRTAGSKLLADAEFDAEDADAKKLQGKVDRGYIKSCSMGLGFDRQYMKPDPDGSYTLTQCELMEASIVAIPANANALKLYSANGELLSEQMVKLSIQTLKSDKNSNMENNTFKLSAPALTALGLANADNPDAVSAAIVEMQSKFNTANQALAALQAEAGRKLKADAESLVAKAIAEGRLTAEVKDSFVQMAVDNYDLAAKVIGAMPVKKSLHGMVANSESEVKTADQFQALSIEKQLQFKNDNPELYKALFA